MEKQMNILKNLFLLAGLAVVLNLKAEQVLVESFNNVSNLAANGWVLDNRSNMPSSTTWAQGDGTLFAAQAGNANAYIINDTSTGVDVVCNWLIMPDIGFIDQLSFYTRAQGLANEVTRMFVMYSPTGAINTGDCVSVPPEKTSQGVSAFGDYQVLMSINDTQAANAYPQDWTQFTVDVNGGGRVAFLYYMETGVPNFNSGTIAIDTITRSTLTSTSVPSLNTYTLAALIFLMFFVGVISKKGGVK